MIVMSDLEVCFTSWTFFTAWISGKGATKGIEQRTKEENEMQKLLVIERQVMTNKMDAKVSETAEADQDIKAAENGKNMS